MNIKIVNKSDNTIPKYAHDGDAAFDLMANEDVTLLPYTTYVIGTGLHMEIPKGYWGAVCSRSGNSIRGLVVANAPGVIDSNFRGEVKCIMRNDTERRIKVNKGDRIAQIIIQRHESVTFEEVESLDATERGEKGLGSTGI